MTLEERAEFIASTGRVLPGSHKWRLLRERALQQLQEVAGAHLHCPDHPLATMQDRDGNRACFCGWRGRR